MVHLVLGAPQGKQGKRGPQGKIGASVTDIGFSANRTSTTVDTDQQLDDWSTGAPHYNGTGFDPTTGIYTIPSSGRYALKAVLSYTTTAALQASIGGGVNPSLSMRNMTSGNDIVSGLFPILNVNIAGLLELRAILGNGTVTLVSDAFFNTGDQIGIFYVADGLTLDINLGGTNPSENVWSIHKIANS